MLLVPERSHEPEIMDRADNSAEDLRGALRDIRWVNRFLGGRKVLLDALRPHILAVPRGRSIDVLDVGTGAADLALAMADEIRRHGRLPRVTAVDNDPCTSAIARAETAARADVNVVRSDAFALPLTRSSFDIVTASMFLHHFRQPDVVRLLGEFLRVARRAVLVNDLRRHRVPHAFISIVARAARCHPMFAHDAPLSVLRGFTSTELEDAAREAGVEASRVTRRWPFRIVLQVPGGGAR